MAWKRGFGHPRGALVRVFSMDFCCLDLHVCLFKSPYICIYICVCVFSWEDCQGCSSQNGSMVPTPKAAILHGEDDQQATKLQYIAIH